MTTIPLLSFEEEDDEAAHAKAEEEYRNSVAKAKANIKLEFLEKVEGLLSMQVLLSTIVGAVCILQKKIKQFLQSKAEIPIVGFLLSILLLTALGMKKKKTPTNFNLLTAFTVAEASSIAIIISHYDHYVVLQAVLVTAGSMIWLMSYGMQTRHNLTPMGTKLFISFWILLVGGFVMIFIENIILEFILSLSGVFLFSLFIVYDTEKITNRVSPEEYILATTTLYMDVVNLFIFNMMTLLNIHRQCVE